MLLSVSGLDFLTSMSYGTAGLTASACIKKITDAKCTDKLPVIVSGSSGGVGSVAIGILSKIGYEVHALTGKTSHEETLKEMGEKKFYIGVKGHLEGTLACFEIIAKQMNFPFKKENIKNSLKKYLINNKYLSLKVCGEIASYHGLQINISNINPEMANRIVTPGLIKWEDDFAVISGINREGIEIIIPSEGYKNMEIVHTVRQYYTHWS